jgi:mannosyltransferase
MNLWRQTRWPFLIFVLALLPRLVRLGARPFWLDEVFTLQRASLAPGALVQNSFLNHHMPSFFLMLSPLVPLGDPQFWLRLPSAVFGALCVVLVYLIARSIAGRTAGFMAALIIGLSPAALAFSQEARSYTMEMFLILVALYGITRLAQDIPAASEPMQARGARVSWAMFILGTTAALDVLGDSLPWLLTANLIGAALLPQSPSRRQLLKNFLLADLIVAALSVPFYVMMLFQQANSFVDSVMWIPPLDISRAWYDFGSVYFMHIADSVTFNFMNVPTPRAVLWLIDAGLAVAVLTAAWALRQRRAMLAVLGISFVFLPLMFTVVSIWRPILLPRYILWSAAPFAILAGIGAAKLLEWFEPRRRLVLAGAAGLLLLANMAPYYHAETKPRWDIAAKLLSQDFAPGDVLYLYDNGALPILSVYLPSGQKNIVLANSADGLGQAQQAMSQGKRVWAVFGHAGQSGGSREMMKFYAQAQVLGTPKIMQAAGDRIFIALYDPHDSAPTCQQTAPDEHMPGACS